METGNCQRGNTPTREKSPMDFQDSMQILLYIHLANVFNLNKHIEIFIFTSSRISSLINKGCQNLKKFNFDSK